MKIQLPKGFTWREAKNEDSEEIKNLVFSVLREYGLDVDPKKTDADLDRPADFYKDGFFALLSNAKEEIIATFALLEYKENVVEIRKMYLLPAYRGLGLGRFMMRFLLAKAKEMGYSKVMLETASPLKEAVAMYEKYGFVLDEKGPHTERCDKMYFLEIN